MSFKEPTDELNPEVLVTGHVGRVPTIRTAGDYLALGIATCGVGFIPLAPGTWGSLVGVLIFLLLRWVAVQVTHFSRNEQGLLTLNPQLAFVAIELFTILVITLFGIWAASRTEKLLGRKDPGKVVVDEVAGQLISLLPIPLVFVWPWKIWVIVSFILFRFFDIVKPYPARRLEGLQGGLGIMADDLVAGAYAATSTAVLLLIFGLFFV